MVTGKLIQTLHLRFPSAVSNETKRFGNIDGVVELLPVGIRLTDQNDRGSRFGMKEPLHRSKCDRLIFRNQLAVTVARRPQLKYRGQRRDDHAQREKHAAVFLLLER